MEESSLKKRLSKRLAAYILVTILIGVILVGMSSLRIATNAINQERVQNTEKELAQIRNQTQIEIFFSIFKNNYFIALNFLPPIAGPVFFVLVMYSTAEIFAARSIELSNNTLSPYLISFLYIFSLMFSPTVLFFGFLEFLGYAIAIAQSFYLIGSALRTIKERQIAIFTNELKFTAYTALIIALILLLAAYLESLLV